MRVVLASEVALGNVNGVTSTVQHLLRGLPDRLTPDLLAPRGSRPVHPDVAASRANAVLLPSVGLPGYPEVAIGLATRRWLKRTLQDLRPDIVHLVDPMILGSNVGEAAHELGIPVLASYHTKVADYVAYYGFARASALAWSLTRRAYRRAERVLVPTCAVGDELTRHGVRGVRLWMRGVDTARFRPENRDEALHLKMAGGRPFVAVYVGRLAAEKNLEFLVEALAPCRSVRLVLIGEGPHRATLSRNPMSAEVLFTGELTGTELADHVASADVAVTASESESYGQAVVESMASGLPVVAVDCPVLREVTGGVDSARFFQPGDSGALRREVEDVLRDQPARKWMVARGLQTALSRQWTTAVEQLMGHYEELANAERRSSSSMTAEGRQSALPCSPA